VHWNMFRPLMRHIVEHRLSADPYYPVGTIGTVPRAYEGTEGRKKEYK
jgi:hypothetical protein